MLGLAAGRRAGRRVQRAHVASSSRVRSVKARTSSELSHNLLCIGQHQTRHRDERDELQEMLDSCDYNLGPGLEAISTARPS
jgi:hypothetical protein